MKCLAILVLCLAITVVNSSQQQVDYENPIRSADDDEVTNLPGLNTEINFKQYSGYLRGDDEPKTKKFLHYWFVERETDPANAPLLLWLNGGPGCSSLGGMFTELGPFVVNDDSKTLRMNEYSWNKVANVLFLESPTGVGFSYSSSFINIHTDDTTARENYHALKSFLEKFPQYKNSPLYLSGESYAGVYLPTLGVLVDADPEMNLKGIAIGNGYLDVAKLSDSLIFFSYAHGLVGKSTWDRISKECCGGKPPAQGTCRLSGVGYGCSSAVNDVLSVLSSKGLNPYNLYGPCLSEQASSKELVDRAMMNLAFNSSLLTDSEQPFHIFDARENGAQNLGVTPPCFDDHVLVHYLNTQAVREAIHVPKKVGSWDTCSIMIYMMKYPKLPGGLAPQMKSLISSKRKLAMLVYNGDVDTVCNFLGDEWFVDGLGRKVISDYQVWHAEKQVAGYVKHYDGITFATVRGSGHMVPSDRPVEALKMIETFLSSKCQNVEL